MASRLRNARLAMAGTAAMALTVTSIAQADPSAADRETARSMMVEGRGLRDKGDVKGALQRFKTADGIMHVPTTGLEVARTEVSLGMLLEARDTIAAIRNLPSSPDDPQPFTDARTKADELDASVEGRIPSVTVTVGGVAEGDTPAVSIDGVSVPSAAAGLPRKVDPGHHVVTAKAAAGEAKEEIDVAEGEKKQIQLVIAGSGSPTPPRDENAAPAATPAAESGTKVHTPTVLTWTGAGVGGAGLIAGVITGILSMSKVSTLKGECTGKVCSTPTAQSDYDSANSLATISDIGYIVAVAGAGVAVATLLIGHSADSEASDAPAAAPAPDAGGDAPAATPAPAPESRLRVIPWIGAGSAGVFGTF
jgi:hypothetical protein